MTRKSPRRDDANAEAAGLLADMSAIQTIPQKTKAYARAAAAVMHLDAPVASLRQPDRSLRKIPNIGPSSTQVLLEFLDRGESPTVERAVAASGKQAEVIRGRGLRVGFLSRAAVVAVLDDRRLTGVAREDHHGDLQMHSTWSDGAEPIASLAASCAARGYRFCAITDHGPGLPIARSVSMADLERQHREIDQLNRASKGRFRILKGIEANVTPEGGVDLTPGDLARFELVLAAPHSKLRVAEDQTPRLLKTVRTAGVHVLAHPRGRQYSSRAGIAADWSAIFAEAARTGVAIELDGDPNRQDIDCALASRALAAGCLFALDSDAHASGELRYADWALAHARLAGIPADRIVNCWDLDRLLSWAAEAGRR